MYKNEQLSRWRITTAEKGGRFFFVFVSLQIFAAPISTQTPQSSIFILNKPQQQQQ